MDFIEKHQMRRLTDYLEKYWDDLRGHRNFPSKDEVDMDKLDMKIRDDCFIADITPSVSMHNVKIDYLGRNLNAKYEHEDDGLHIQNAISSFLETPSEEYEILVDKKKPVMKSDEMSIGNGKKLKYRQILLPLGPNDEGEVTAILGGMRYKTD